MNARANLHLFGKPDTSLAPAGRRSAVPRAAGQPADLHRLLVPADRLELAVGEYVIK